MIKVSLFAEQERESKLGKIGDALSKLREHVDFAALAEQIDAAAPLGRAGSAAAGHRFQQNWRCECWWCSISTTSATSRWSSSSWIG